MVVIKEIKRNKKSYTLVVGEETLKDVNVEVALSYGLKEGEMEEEKFREFLKENDRANAKAYLYNMLSRKNRTVKEARDKLYEKGYHKDAVEYAIEAVSRYGYLDDLEYAKNFVESAMRNKGSYRLRQELKLKGVSEENLTSALENLETETEYIRARELAKKHLGEKDMEDEKVRQRLFRFLVSRGYSYDVVKNVMKELGAEMQEE